MVIGLDRCGIKNIPCGSKSDIIRHSHRKIKYYTTTAVKRKTHVLVLYCTRFLKLLWYFNKKN